MNITLLVNKSDPDSTIITKPTGNTIAPMVRIKPGKSEKRLISGVH